MTIRKEELVLYSLSLLKEPGRPGSSFTKVQLAMALDISDNTLDLYMSKLSHQGLIDRIKKRYVADIRETYSITEKGSKEAASIVELISGEYLTPERHNIESMVPLTTILKRIDDPLERIFVLSLYSGLKYFDLPVFLETIRTAKQDSTMINTLSGLSETGAGEETPVVETFFRACFYGDIDAEELQNDQSFGTNINTLLIVAEASYKQGRFNESLAIYDHVLSPAMKTTQGQWVVARAGKALVLSKMGDIDGSIALLDETEGLVENKILGTFVLQVKARILSTTERREESMKLFDHVIRSFSSSKIPLLLAIAHNNRGILHYRNEENEEAERDFQRSRRYLNDSKREYLFGPLYNNLAGIEVRKGDLKKAEEYLDRSETAYRKFSDHEGLSYVDFTRSMMYIEKRDTEKAMELLNRSETIAYPSPSVLEREERRDIFRSTAKSKGLELPDL